MEGECGFGRTPLHEACESGDYAEALELLSRGAIASHVSRFDGTTPLHAACRRPQHPLDTRVYMGPQHMEVLEKLVSQSPVDQPSHTGFTPLHYLCVDCLPSTKAIPYVRLLLDHGADTNLAYSRYLHLEITEDRDGYGSDSSDCLRAPYSPPYVRLPKGSTSLHIACARGHHCLAELLLEHGADPNQRNVSEWTAGHAAVASVRGPCPELLLLLADHGADLTSGALVSGTANVTPLHQLLQSPCPCPEADEQSSQIVGLLLKRMPEEARHIKDSRGRSIVHVAIENGYLHMLEFLWREGSDVRDCSPDVNGFYAICKTSSLPVLLFLLDIGVYLPHCGYVAIRSYKSSVCRCERLLAFKLASAICTAGCHKLLPLLYQVCSSIDSQTAIIYLHICYKLGTTQFYNFLQRCPEYKSREGLFPTLFDVTAAALRKQAFLCSGGHSIFPAIAQLQLPTKVKKTLTETWNDN